MKYQDMVERFGSMPLIESSALRLFYKDHGSMSVQLDRWVKTGRLIQLRRGAYLLPSHLQRAPASLDHLANLLYAPSYVSCERASYLHGLIPESVPQINSVTPRRPLSIDSPIARFRYRHVKPSWFFGYAQTQVAGDAALVARPAKAILDLVHLSRGEFSPARIEALRLQNLMMLDPEELLRLAGPRATPRVRRAAKRIALWIENEQKETKDL